MQQIIREQDPVKPSTKLTTLGDKLRMLPRCRRYGRPTTQVRARGLGLDRDEGDGEGPDTSL